MNSMGEQSKYPPLIGWPFFHVRQIPCHDQMSRYEETSGSGLKETSGSGLKTSGSGLTFDISIKTETITD